MKNKKQLIELGKKYRSVIVKRPNEILFPLDHAAAFAMLLWVIPVLMIGCYLKKPEQTPTALVTPHAAVEQTTPVSTPTHLPILEPRPKFVIDVRPQEQSLTPLSQLMGQAEFGELCVELDLFHIVQPGDFLDAVTLESKVSLILNGKEAPQVSLFQVDTLNIVEFEGKETYFSGPLTYCWNIGNKPAIYQTILQIEQTSGNILDYAWMFSLTDE